MKRETPLPRLILSMFPAFTACYHDGLTYCLFESDGWIWYPTNPRQLWNVANRLGKDGMK
jgi:hypothetical protein